MDKQYFIEQDGKQVPVTEEVYRAYKQPLWAEHKRKEREKRCIVSDGKGGTKRCDGDCGKCDRQRTGSVLSLDSFAEDGFEVFDPAQDVAEIVADKLILEELFKALEELDPDSRRICKLISQGASEREIATMFGIRQSTFNYRKNKLMAQLRDRLKNYR